MTFTISLADQLIVTQTRPERSFFSSTVAPGKKAWIKQHADGCSLENEFGQQAQPYLGAVLSSGLFHLLKLVRLVTVSTLRTAQCAGAAACA
jgi:hypothetical protein